MKRVENTMTWQGLKTPVVSCACPYRPDITGCKLPNYLLTLYLCNIYAPKQNLAYTNKNLAYTNTNLAYTKQNLAYTNTNFLRKCPQLYLADLWPLCYVKAIKAGINKAL